MSVHYNFRLGFINNPLHPITMEQDITQKALRLLEIVEEAKQLIAEIEKYAKPQRYAEFKDIFIAQLDIPKGSLTTRFMKICYNNGIVTLQELLNTPASLFKKCNNSGSKTILWARQAIQDRYGVVWEK